MQRRIVLTFSGVRYHDTTKLIVENAQKFGATEPPWVYDDVWLKECRPEFCAATKWAFDHPKVRGVNWFCWKPFIILDALKRANDGDIICFIDADTWPILDMTPLFDHCDKEGMMLFAACGHSQRHWSKRDTQIVMGMDSSYWRNKQAGVARFMLFKKGEKVNDFQFHGAPMDLSEYDQSNTEWWVRTWLMHTCHPLANTFDKSILGEEYPDLKEARCEQAILTNIAHRQFVPLHRECDQWGNDFKKDFPNDTYGQIFESTGVYSYAPEPRGPGSAFRNMKD